MPYKNINSTIPRDLKKSVKLSLQDRKDIIEDYKIMQSQRGVARKWNVSRRLIQFIIDPIKEQENKELQKQKNYYDKDKHSAYIRKHRHYKQQLYLKGELEEWN